MPKKPKNNLHESTLGPFAKAVSGIDAEPSDKRPRPNQKSQRAVGRVTLPTEGGEGRDPIRLLKALAHSREHDDEVEALVDLNLGWWSSGSRRRKFATSERLPPPATEPASPAAAETTAARKESDEKEQHDRADRGVDDEADGPDTEMDVQPWQQPIADERTDDSDDQVTDEAEAAASHDLTRQPAGNDADH